MKNRVQGVFVIIIGALMIMFCMVTKTNDKQFYKDAKQTNATIDKITQEEKTVYRKRGKVRRKKTVIEYDAHISYQIDKDGEIIPQTAVLSDVSSNLKAGDTISVYYKDNDVRIRSQEQSDFRNTFFGILGAVMLIIGVIGVKLSKSNNEYDELSGEENIYNEK